MIPLLRVSGLSGRVMLLTRYSVHVPMDRSKPSHIVATTKYDVTAEFVAALGEWRKLQRRQRAAAARSARRPTAPPQEPQAGGGARPS